MWRLFTNQIAIRRRNRSASRQTIESLELRTLLSATAHESTDYATYLVLFEDDPQIDSAALTASHHDFTQLLEHQLGEPVSVRYDYSYAINGMAMLLTPIQAELVSDLPSVSNVLLDSFFQRQQNSAELTGAPDIWTGAAAGSGAGTLGEGVLIGVIDSGIDFDNASFAEIGPNDGYQHTNPLGDGVYRGVCDSTNADFNAAYACNNKIVGAYDFTDDTLVNDSIFADHGTSVAGIAAGNFLSTEVPNTSQTTEISGVAPHANLISYDVCDSNDNCSSSAILAAVDQAIADGVDVVNLSIGGPTEDPWSAVMSQAMWNAHNAGIFVAVSAGNAGPEAASVTAPADSPWVTAVASTGTGSITAVNIDVVGENLPSRLTGIATIRGENLNVLNDVGPAPIVHSAEISPGDHLGSSAYPSESLAGQVALIDRGTSLFETKVRHAWEAGAIGVVMINNVDGPLVTMSGVSQFPIPSVMISQADGEYLRQWLQDNPESQIRINAQQVQQRLSVAPFSSRGENEQADTLAPHVAAPGADTSVIAPVATGGEDVWEFFSGTSAASPHVAGAAALLTAIHPDWSPSEIQSALQTTASNPGIVTGSALIEANAFDIGSGQIDVAAAVNAGLVLDETSSRFQNADPSNGGDPSALNLASFVASDVAGTTSWARTVTSTQQSTVTWTPVFVAEDGLTLKLDKTEIVAAAGTDVSFTLTAAVADGIPSEWLFGDVTLVPNTDLPKVRFPVAVKPTPTPGVAVKPSGSGTDTSEAGTTDEYVIQLLTDPDGLVQIEVNAPPELEISSDGESFSSSVLLVIKNAFPRTVTVRATDDSLAESTRLEQVTHAIVETTDADYPVSRPLENVEVRIFDNDIGQLSLTTAGSKITEGGQPIEATVGRSANSDLSQALFVSLSPTDNLLYTNSAAEPISTIEIPVGQTSATFYVAAIDNSEIDGSRTLQVEVSVPSYQSASQSMEILDDDIASLKTIETSGGTSVNRSGSTDSFTAQLRTQPSSDVVFDVIVRNSDTISADVQRLTFTADDWQTPQTVVVTGLDDGLTGLVETDVSLTIVPAISAEEYHPVGPVSVIVSLLDSGGTTPTILGPRDRTLTDPVTVRWTPVENVESYGVYVERIGDSTNPVLDVTTTDTFYQPGQLGIGAYRFWVRANLAAGASSPWIGGTFQITTAPTFADVPFYGDDPRPQFSWDDVTGATAYQIYISNRTTGQNGLFNVPGLTKTTYSPDVDLTFGEHRVWVRAFGIDGFAADWSAPVDYFVGPELQTPVASTFVVRPVFQWTSPAQAVTHEIFIRQPDGTSIVETGLSTSFQPEEELQAGRHVWWVRAATADGQKGAWSQPSETYIGGRTNLAKIGTASNASPVFAWDAVEGAEQYELFLNRTDVATHLFSLTLETTSWQSTILPDGEYTTWIRPVSAAGEPGFWSPASEFAIKAAQTRVMTEPTQNQFVSFDNTLTLTWTPNQAAELYEVFVHNGETAIHQTQLLSTEWITPDLGEGTATWWVRAVDSFGDFGPWSSAAVIDTTGRTIGNPPSVSDEVTVFTWSPVVGADRYILQVDNQTTGETRVVREDQLTSATFTTNETLASGRYRFWVRAIRNSDVSEGFWSFGTEFSIP